MNVARFQIALNHESPGIVILGLDEFRKQILIDHNCTNSYGYYGRPYCNNDEELLEVKTPQKIVGVLENYIKSSPLAEELFVLWKLPGRDNNRQLSACHTACISAIIHCSTSNTAFVQLIIQRILHEHVRSIHNQLTSGDVNLVHATLGLLLCIARSAPQNALDSYQKLIATHSIFGSIIQKGKTVSWKPMANDMNKQDDGNIASGDNENGILTYGNFNDEVSTDARLFMVLILFHTLQSNGQTDDIGLFSSNSLIRRVLHAINNDTAAVLDVILSGIARLLKNSVAAVTYLPSLVDTTFIKKIFNLYYHENTEIEMLAKVFVFNLCELLSTKSLLPSYSGSHSGAIAITISNIVNIMDPVEHSSQRELLMMLLEAQPSLFARSLGKVNSTVWDSNSVDDICNGLGFLSYLLNSKILDSKLKASLRAFIAIPNQDSDFSSKSVIEILQSNIICSTLTKKDLTRFLAHQEQRIQRAATSYILAIVQRVERLLKSVGGKRFNSLEIILLPIFSKYLPEFQNLLSTRTRLAKAQDDVKNDQQSTQNVLSVTPGKEKTRMEGNGEIASTMELVADLEFNIDVDQTDSLKISHTAISSVQEIEKESEMNPRTGVEGSIVAIVQVISVYIILLPSYCSSSNFDLIRLLDDITKWDEGQELSDVLTNFDQSSNELVLTVLKLLSQDFAMNNCQWFGSKEEVLKQFINIIVTDNWPINLKRNTIAKLLILMQSPNIFIQSKSRQIFFNVISSSGLFSANSMGNEVEQELRTEMQIWESFLLNKNRSMKDLLLISVIFPLAYHWNTELCITALNTISKGESKEGDSPVRFSPVLYCLMNLASGNLTTFATDLPKYIRQHIEQVEIIKSVDNPSTVASESVSFFKKYIDCSVCVLENLFTKLVLSISQCLLDPLLFLESLQLSLKGLARGSLLVEADQPLSLTGSISWHLNRWKDILPASRSGHTRGGSIASKSCTFICEDKTMISIYEFIANLRKELNLKKVINCSKKIKSEADNKLCFASNIDLIATNLQEIVPILSRLHERNSDCPLSDGLQEILDFTDSYWYTISYCYFDMKSEINEAVVEWMKTLWTRDNVSAEGKYCVSISLRQSLLLLYLLCSKLDNQEDKRYAVVSYVVGLDFDDRETDIINSDLHLDLASGKILMFTVRIFQYINSIMEQLYVQAILLDTSYLFVDSMKEKNIFGIFSSVIFTKLLSVSNKNTNMNAKLNEKWLLVTDNLLPIIQESLSSKFTGRSKVDSSLQKSKISKNKLFESHVQATDGVESLFKETIVKLAWLLYRAVAHGSLKATIHQYILSMIRLNDDFGETNEWLLTVLQSLTNGDTKSIRNDNNSSGVDETVKLFLNRDILLSMLKWIMNHSSETRKKAGDLLAIVNSSLLQYNSEVLSENYVGIGAQYFNASALFDQESYQMIVDNYGNNAMTDSSIKLRCKLLNFYYCMPFCHRQDITSNVDTISVLSPLLHFEISNDILHSRNVHDDLEIANLLGRESGYESHGNEIFQNYRVFIDHIFKNIVQKNAHLEKITRNLLELLSSMLKDYDNNRTTDTEITMMSTVAINVMAITMQRLATLCVDDEESILYELLFNSNCLLFWFGVGGNTDSYKNISDNTSLLWWKTFGQVLIVVLNQSTKQLTELLIADDLQVVSVRHTLQRIITLLEIISINRILDNINSSDLNSLSPIREGLKRALNQFFKVCMKNGLQSYEVIYAMKQLLKLLYFHGITGSVGSKCFNYYFLPSAEDCFHAKTMLTLIVGHSKFNSILRNNDTNIDSKKPGNHLLLLLLLLFSIRFSGQLSTTDSFNQENEIEMNISDEHSRIDDGNEEDKEVIVSLLDILLQLYDGTLSTASRIILRILYLLQQHGLCNALCVLIPKQSMNNLRTNKSYVDWLTTFITPAKVHPTISRFPVSRSIDIPVVLESELETLLTSSTTESGDDIGMLAKFKERVCKGKTFDTSNDLIDVGKFELLLNSNTEKVLDPAFIMPLILHCLRCRSSDTTLSIRQLSNNGVLSVVILSLSSHCPKIRIYALACLQIVSIMILKQTAEINAAFKERPQLMLLLDYIRHAIDYNELGSSSNTVNIAKISATSAIYFAKAAMVVLQPQHELYSGINKYLVGRPFHDNKDIPLFDLVLLHADMTEEQPQRLEVLRMVRDGMKTKQDHLNMCRKNGYNRLMLLFPSLSNDVRVGNIILDIIEKCISFQYSLRYLLDRCDLLTWLVHRSLPVSAHVVGNPADVETIRHNYKYSVRCVVLLNKLINNYYLNHVASSTQFNEVNNFYIKVGRVAEILVLRAATLDTDIASKDFIADFYSNLLQLLWNYKVCVQYTTDQFGTNEKTNTENGSSNEFATSIIQLLKRINQLELETTNNAVNSCIALLSLADASFSSDAKAGNFAIDLTMSYADRHIRASEIINFREFIKCNHRSAMQVLSFGMAGKKVGVSRSSESFHNSALLHQKMALKYGHLEQNLLLEVVSDYYNVAQSDLAYPCEELVLLYCLPKLLIIDLCHENHLYSDSVGISHSKLLPLLRMMLIIYQAERRTSHRNHCDWLKLVLEVTEIDDNTEIMWKLRWIIAITLILQRLLSDSSHKTLNLSNQSLIFNNLEKVQLLLNQLLSPDKIGNDSITNNARFCCRNIANLTTVDSNIVKTVARILSLVWEIASSIITINDEQFESVTIAFVEEKISYCFNEIFLSSSTMNSSVDGDSSTMMSTIPMIEEDDVATASDYIVKNYLRFLVQQADVIVDRVATEEMDGDEEENLDNHGNECESENSMEDNSDHDSDSGSDSDGDSDDDVEND